MPEMLIVFDLAPCVLDIMFPQVPQVIFHGLRPNYFFTFQYEDAPLFSCMGRKMWRLYLNRKSAYEENIQLNTHILPPSLLCSSSPNLCLSKAGYDLPASFIFLIYLMNTSGKMCFPTIVLVHMRVIGFKKFRTESQPCTMRMEAPLIHPFTRTCILCSHGLK